MVSLDRIKIMRQSRNYPESDVVTKVSDVVFLRNVRKSLASWVAGPFKLKGDDLTMPIRAVSET